DGARPVAARPECGASDLQRACRRRVLVRLGRRGTERRAARPRGAVQRPRQSAGALRVAARDGGSARMSERLSWPRLKALLRNESIGEYRVWLIASAVTFGAMLVGAMYLEPSHELIPPY